jgi:hypothetical protein
MMKLFDALIKLIQDFVASYLSRQGFQLNVSYATFLGLEIWYCALIACINIDIRKQCPCFRYVTFLLGLIEMCCITVKGVMDILDANGLFYGIHDRNNTTKII